MAWPKPPAATPVANDYFGQPDGIEVRPGPLGHAVDVPENGVVRVRAERQEVMSISKVSCRATYFVSPNPDGSRRIMKVLTDVYRDSGIWRQGVIDETPT